MIKIIWALAFFSYQVHAKYQINTTTPGKGCLDAELECSDICILDSGNSLKNVHCFYSVKDKDQQKIYQVGHILRRGDFEPGLLEELAKKQKDNFNGFASQFINKNKDGSCKKIDRDIEDFLTSYRMLDCEGRYKAMTDRPEIRQAVGH